MDPLYVSVLVFLVVTGGATAIYVVWNQRRLVNTRMADVALKARRNMADGGLLAAADDHQMTRNLLKWAVGRLPKPKASAPRTVKLGELLVQAGFKSPNATAVFQLAKIASTICGVALGILPAVTLGMSGSKMMLLGIAGAAFGSFVPAYYIGRRAKNRQADIGRQLSDVLDLLVVCVEAGLGLLEAIKVVGQETESQNLAIGHELMMVAGEVNAGSSLGQALRALADRTAVDDVKPLAATLIQSEQLGGAIGPALRSISDAIRTRRRIRAEESAQKTTVKILFPLVLMILPAMLLVIVGPAIVQTLRTLSC
jgi:tight adherence protein C